MVSLKTFGAGHGARKIPITRKGYSMGQFNRSHAVTFKGHDHG